MAIGLFFLILAILLAVAMPVGGVFGLMAMLPNLLNSSFSYAAGDVARGMFAGLNSFTLLAVPLFMQHICIIVFSSGAVLPSAILFSLNSLCVSYRFCM